MITLEVERVQIFYLLCSVDQIQEFSQLYLPVVFRIRR